jgi:hypothetical protein
LHGKLILPALPVGGQTGTRRFEMKTYTLTVRNDDEGFLGNDPDVIVNVDFDKSLEAYNQEVIAAAAKSYPDVEIIMDYGNYSGSSFLMTCNTGEQWDVQQMNDIQNDISDMIGEIYAQGNFWTEK